MSNQGTDDWKMDRLGKFTGSRAFPAIDLDSKGKLKAAYWNYVLEAATERWKGAPIDKFVTPAMANGTRLEPTARVRFMLETGLYVRQVGFINHKTIAMSGASLDGIIHDNQSIEIKCPMLKNHFEYTATGEIPMAYQAQMQWGMATVPSIHSCWFVSFNPDAPTNIQMHIQRVDRDPVMIAQLERAAEQFNRDVEEKLRELRETFPSAL